MGPRRVPARPSGFGAAGLSIQRSDGDPALGIPGAENPRVRTRRKLIKATVLSQKEEQETA